MFARALVQEPEILLLDEPASFLDIRHQVEVFEIVRALVEERRRTVLAVLHDLNLAAEYCHRVYLLRDGRLRASGPTAETFTYANLKDAFRTEIYVDTNSLTGKLIVAPLPASARRAIDRDGPADG